MKEGCRLCMAHFAGADRREAREKLRRHMRRHHDAEDVREALGERSLEVFCD